RSVAAICDVFVVPARRPRALALWGSAESGLDTALLDIARAARVNGYVPVAAGLDVRLAALAARRAPFVGVPSPEGQGWRFLLESLMQSARPHVLLFCGDQATCRVETLGIESCTPQSLIGAVRPAPQTPVARQRVATAARSARGLPGRFARLLWRLPV